MNRSDHLSDRPSRLHQLSALWRFYRQAVTRFQVHPPFAFDFVQTVVEDNRRFYAFNDIAQIVHKLNITDAEIDIRDYGAGPGGKWQEQAKPTVRRARISEVARRSGSSPQQGERLFRLINWLKPKYLLEMGGSLGIGTLYMAMAAGRQARLISLEGAESCAGIARLNLEVMQLSNTTVIDGPFEATLTTALQQLGSVDLVFFDGNHRYQPTLDYFETCLTYAHDQSVFVFDDVHWSPGMEAAWKKIQQHPRVTLTIDCWDFACAFFNPDFREKQHFSVVPYRWKPWLFF